MRTIGLIGGMSWESTALYYKLINERVRDRKGKLHSAPLLMYSYDFQDIKEMQYAGRWAEAAASLADVAQRLERAGAAAIVLCTNTMHKLAPDIAARLTIPFIHLGDATAQRIRARGYRRVGLLGTKFTMEEDFYIDRLRAHDLDVLIPSADERADVNRIIYDELCLGVVADASRRRYQEVMAALVGRGADCIILGCTEITMLVGAADTSVETFDTTAIHAEAAADFAIG
jgi:aspartate racemase